MKVGHIKKTLKLKSLVQPADTQSRHRANFRTKNRKKGAKGKRQKANSEQRDHQIIHLFSNHPSRVVSTCVCVVHARGGNDGERLDRAGHRSHVSCAFVMCRDVAEATGLHCMRNMGSGMWTQQGDIVTSLLLFVCSIIEGIGIGIGIGMWQA